MTDHRIIPRHLFEALESGHYDGPALLLSNLLLFVETLDQLDDIQLYIAARRLHRVRSITTFDTGFDTPLANMLTHAIDLVLSKMRKPDDFPDFPEPMPL